MFQGVQAGVHLGCERAWPGSILPSAFGNHTHRAGISYPGFQVVCPSLSNAPLATVCPSASTRTFCSARLLGARRVLWTAASISF